MQFQYGDDMLDPACLEGDATPVEYVRSWSHACVSPAASLAIRPLMRWQRISDRTGRALLPFEVLKFAYEVYPEAALTKRSPRRGQDQKPNIISPDWIGCHEKYRENTFSFIQQKIAKSMAAQRLAHGLPPADTPEMAAEYAHMLHGLDRKHLLLLRNCADSLHLAAITQTLDNANKVTEAQIKAFLDICRIKYLKAKIEPGISLAIQVEFLLT